MIENREVYTDIIQNGNLVGIDPSQVLLHGPTKRLVDTFHWHSPQKGIVASYSQKNATLRIILGFSEGSTR